MSTDIKVGQVWRDKDKRRNTVIEIIDIGDEDGENTEVAGLVVGTEEERWYKAERLQKRWELVEEKVADKVHEVFLADALDRKTGHETREAWLNEAAEELRKFVFIDYEVPQVHVSVGWPGGRGPKANVIGQCWPGTASADSMGHVFISPAVSDPEKVLAALTHELVHAINHKDGDSGHRGAFARIATDIGLEGKMTECTPGDYLAAQLKDIAEGLGTYPHAAISVEEKPKVQKTYMLKFVSPKEPDFFVRMTASKLEEYGAPRDPWGNEMEQE